MANKRYWITPSPLVEKIVEEANAKSNEVIGGKRDFPKSSTICDLITSGQRGWELYYEKYESYNIMRCLHSDLEEVVGDLKEKNEWLSFEYKKSVFVSMLLALILIFSILSDSIKDGIIHGLDVPNPEFYSFTFGSLSVISSTLLIGFFVVTFIHAVVKAVKKGRN